ncbi:MAG: trypsin-like peptidase domain-containing protein [Elusimicrobia bacterium]|nr:trypsin-like peptidase domain-containing protein [Elusimicrobiota bacterium]
MKRNIALIALFVGALRVAASAAEVEGKVIYGSDDRIDIHQTDSARLRALADSTVALFHASSIETTGAVAKLETQPYGESMNLCKEEPFYEQETGAFCSGSLVAPDVIMTAGHCVTSESACAGVKFVFGFAIKEQGKLPASVPAADVYDCKTLLGRAQENEGADWALIRLDRPVTGHAVLNLNMTRKIENNTPLVVIGHPAGLPTKIAGGATVRDASTDGYFVANLDTYGGNSGSAVFNAVNGLVEGILVRGEQDYTWKGDCRVSNVCGSDECRGEDVTKLDAVLDRLPAAEHEDRVAELPATVSAMLEAVTGLSSRP